MLYLFCHWRWHSRDDELRRTATVFMTMFVSTFAVAPSEFDVEVPADGGGRADITTVAENGSFRFRDVWDFCKTAEQETKRCALGIVQVSWW